MILLGLLVVLATPPGVFGVPADYDSQRSNLLHLEQNMRIGGRGISMSSEESLVNSFLLREKKILVDESRVSGTTFPGRDSFLRREQRDFIRQSPAYQVIQKMPKGGVLHVHDEAITSIDWLVKNVTYRHHCYMCVTQDSKHLFKFYRSPPTDSDCSPWELVNNVRQRSGDPDAFDQTLHAGISMSVNKPEDAYTNINAVWRKFMDYFGQTEGLMLYARVFEDYLYEGLRQFREDNVQYLEIRGLLPAVYELDGSTHDKEWVLNVYKSVNDRFLRDYPDFTGFKFIMTSLRFKDAKAMLEDVKEAMYLYQKYPEFMVGFDLVAQEDILHPLQYYLDVLLYPSRQNPPVYLPYFFHAGETNWQGTMVDYNLLDAILLNTTRIGHGYALNKHPLLMKQVKERDIAVEISPISNQVLELVGDLRNHPATALIADDFPVVISSDDPPSWEALPLTDDFYIAYMALLAEDATLTTLKQLAKNSLIYSAMNDAEKRAAIAKWERSWDTFIQNSVAELDL